MQAISIRPPDMVMLSCDGEGVQGIRDFKTL